MAGMGMMVWSGNMKTTIKIDDDLFEAVRNRAASQNQTIRQVVEEALRQLLTSTSGSSYRLELPVTEGKRAPSIDVDSNAAIDEHLDRMVARATADE